MYCVNQGLLCSSQTSAELAWFGTCARLQQSNTQNKFGQAVVKLSTNVCDFGVQLYSELVMKARSLHHASSTCIALRTVLDVNRRKRLVCAIVLFRIDYCNSVLAGLPNLALAPLQHVLNAAARFVADLQPRDHVTKTLRVLHWLLIRQRVN